MHLMTIPAGTGHRLESSPQRRNGNGSDIREFLSRLYGPQATTALDRYRNIEERYLSLFSDEPSILVSTPGRVEIGGNHTDHNNGRVIAASVTLDSVAAAGHSAEHRITLVSEGYASPFEVDLERQDPLPDERETTSALIRGIVARCAEAGYAVGGFRCYLESSLHAGAGLSSSASIEMIIGTILNTLFNDGRIPIEELAAICQYAENVYFGKPCGLMDQLTCGVGGMIAIDFGDPGHPAIHRIRHSLESSGLRFAVVHTGGSHADLTGDYAAIPSEMRAVAAALGKTTCRDIQDEAEILKALPDLRNAVGDRAVIRAIHFVRESTRVPEQVRALEEGRVDDFLALVLASGRSSALWLQNSYATSSPEEQGISLGLALTEGFLEKAGRGACRVHGGGFAGTMLAILPESVMEEYRQMMERVFGEGSVALLDLRSTGTAVFKQQD
jgi:galactokinase